MHEDIRQLVGQGKLRQAVDALLALPDRPSIVYEIAGQHARLLRDDAYLTTDERIKQQNLLSRSILQLLEHWRQADQPRQLRMQASIHLDQDQELRVDQQIVTAPRTQARFTDQHLGVEVYRPIATGWNPPKYLDFAAYAEWLGLPGDPAALAAAVKVMPFGEMIVNGDTLAIQYGPSLLVQIQDNSSTALIDTYLDRLVKMIVAQGGETPAPAEIADARYQLMVGEGELTQIKCSTAFSLNVLHKAHNRNFPRTANLGNVFTSLMRFQNDDIDRLEASDKELIWVSKNKLLDVLLDGRPSDCTIYRASKLIDAGDRLFLVGVQWTPESSSGIEVWEELRTMFDSFGLLNT